MADGDCHSIGGISWLGRRRQLQDSGHHGGYLRLISASIPRHGSLDLSRGVRGDCDPAASGDQKAHCRRLSRTHRAADIVLAEHPLDRDDVGLELAYKGFEGLLDEKEPLWQGQIGRRGDHADVKGIESAPRGSGDHGHATTGETGINPENTHDPSECYPNMCSTL
jgi:hypothetical protein